MDKTHLNAGLTPEQKELLSGAEKRIQLTEIGARDYEDLFKILASMIDVLFSEYERTRFEISQQKGREILRNNMIKHIIVLIDNILRETKK